MISIIIPVYNVERFLKNCVRSVISQDYQDVEVILVNDASTDNSLQVCRELSESDPRIRVIDKPVNEGLDMARYSGLAAMSSESGYVLFIDSDDWLESGILSRCYRVAKESGADYVQMGMQRVFDRWKILKRPLSPGVDYDKDKDCLTIEAPELFDRYYASFFGLNLLSVNAWGKLYKKTVFDNADLKPSGLRWGEDLIMNMWLFPHLKKVAIINDVGYNYRVGGMTSRYLPALMPAAEKMFLYKEAAIEKYGYDKATYPARVEMKNILRTDICQRLSYRIGSPEENVRYIDGLLANPLWDRVGELAMDSRHASDEFVQALGRKDAKALYDVCASFTKPYGLKRKMQELILKLIS